jgi:GTPase
LHRTMNSHIQESMSDADVMIYITEPEVKDLGELEGKLRSLRCPLLILINKADQETADALGAYAQFLQSLFPEATVKIISALHGFNVEYIIPFISEHLKEHPPYFDKEHLSDRDLRFFVSEIIREKLLLLFFREIPYCAEVVIDEFKEDEDMSRIRAIIYVERETQKMIVLGKGGSAIKKLGIQARKDIEKFIGQKVYLDLTVKVLKNWRNDETILKKLGYS